MVTTSTTSRLTVRARSAVPARSVVAPLGLAAAIGGVVAVVAAYHLQPGGSHNLDEPVYLN